MADKFTRFTVEGMEGGYPDKDGKPLAFRMMYDFNEISDMEPVVNLNLLPALANPDRMSAGQMRAITCALLKTAHPQVTLKEAGSLLTNDSPTVMNAVFETLGMVDNDEALFRAIAKLSVERPVVLVEMLSRIKPLLYESPLVDPVPTAAAPVPEAQPAVTTANA